MAVLNCHIGRNEDMPFCYSILNAFEIRYFWKCRRLALVMQTNIFMAKDFNKKSVLIVDDDERMLRALDKVLTSEGAAVTCSSRAGSAIGALTEEKIPVDLVIIDLSMPSISGLTAMHTIHNYRPRLPIIVLTAFGSPAVRAECLREGAVAFLEKPLDSHVLIDAIKGVLAQAENGTNGNERMAKCAGQFESDQGKGN